MESDNSPFTEEIVGETDAHRYQLMFQPHYEMIDIKEEPEVDPLALEGSDDIYLDRKKHPSEIKMEYVNCSYNLKLEVNSEQNPMPITFPLVKCEPQEEDALSIEETTENVFDKSIAVNHEKGVMSIGTSYYHLTKEKCSNLEEYDKNYVPSMEDTGEMICGIDADDISLKCNICGKTFGHKANLKRHVLRAHNLERSFQCDVCGVSFTKSETLKKHSFQHTGEKPFKCEVCGKGYVRKDGLKNHSLQHMGVNPFNCAICGKSYTQSGTLKRHEMLHFYDKPFKCQDCGKTFRSSDNLKIHALQHSAFRL
ncbi:zinc finger protein 596-like isoform X5 [Periplaneta americana]|uniref:zinc finger protein 596-like isoform X5 n=1 Tax=Periplaneta americana TaxID=6978 RepID=UPI0037E98AE0